MTRLPNPIRGVILLIGLGLARLGLVAPERVRRTTDLSWPRIVTGVARMSKNAVDVAMVGIAIGPAAIAGVGLASAYWGIAFALGGGFAAGTIALVSQRYGANAFKELGQAVRSSLLVVVAATVPVMLAFVFFPVQLITLINGDANAIAFGALYLQIVGFAVPFAGVNLIGSRIYIGLDDAWTPMLVRAGGAISNIVFSALFIFGLDMGVAGAAFGTLLANVLVTVAFTVGLVNGRLPGAGDLPVTIDLRGAYVDWPTMRQITEIGLPVVGRSMVWTVANFPMLAIVGMFGAPVLAAYVISRRIWGIMNTPGWGFGLASSSLVGQELGSGNERTAEAYGREIVRFSVATYIVAAALVAVFAEPIVLAFVGGRADPSFSTAVTLVYVSCFAVIAQGVSGASAGPLDASGDTTWPFLSQALGMFAFSIPVAYLGATTSLAYWGLYLSFVAETTVPAALNYYRFSTGKWKLVSRKFRPGSAVADD
ncbi:MATE family efflux transporter [Haloprofundus sp. MHR1]|uniref:MATE family efflux transporter n=1 Tax=Haloprofundus sp. MHR1 TaxID=2572921 RepID=UPI0010BE2EF4|nr:MATE family efflux transporter [Haloprofundus sp. MHR1]QCJ47300.1 MATE family efflux transporter [Haloprofundus sp. MHR1]